MVKKVSSSISKCKRRKQKFSLRKSNLDSFMHNVEKWTY